jgi:carboxylesterase type B
VSEILRIKNHKQRKMTPFPKQANITIDTMYGKVVGMVGDVMGKDVSAFLGVPYARPPISKLRFQKSVKPRPWKQAIDASTFKPHCVQDFREDILLSRSLTTLLMSEDCLYMNIWSADVSAAELKPVMVWVYGGSFKGGTANIDETDGRVLAALGDVVVVTFNYRAGSLGFLDILSPEASGNQVFHRYSLMMYSVNC